MPSATWAAVSLDCDEPRTLAAFWAAMLDGSLEFESDDFCAVKFGSGWLTATRVPDYQAPTWPDPGVPKQAHLDLAAADLDLAESEAVALGACRAETQPAPDRWRVLLDPAGHPFCVSSMMPSDLS